MDGWMNECLNGWIKYLNVWTIGYLAIMYQPEMLLSNNIRMMSFSEP
jgi:hypothetical protein